MNILQKPLPRRTFLRGLGATMALPFLDSMVPSSTAARAAGQSPVRLGYIYRPNGMVGACDKSPRPFFSHLTAASDERFARGGHPLTEDEAEATARRSAERIARAIVRTGGWFPGE